MNKGFSLIELIIVLAIVSILAIAIVPSYHDHVIRARRLDGQTALLDLAMRMERYFSENNTYQTATIGTKNPTTDVLSSNTSPEGWYTLSIIMETDSTYTLEATPARAQAINDRHCPLLTFDSFGTKNGSSSSTCW